ncbi:hypothetical protein HN51_039978 [Arachis hypogaea]
MSRYKQNQLFDDEKNKLSLPTISSACPEKQLRLFILPNISKIKSLQQIIGAIIKYYLYQDIRLK